MCWESKSTVTYKGWEATRTRRYVPRNNGATFDGDSNLSITDDLVDTCNEITCRVFASRIVDFSRNSILPFVGCPFSPAFILSSSWNSFAKSGKKFIIVERPGNSY